MNKYENVMVNMRIKMHFSLPINFLTLIVLQYNFSSQSKFWRRCWGRNGTIFSKSNSSFSFCLQDQRTGTITVAKDI